MGTNGKLGPEELAKLSRKSPGTIIIGSGYRHRLSITLAARKFLREKNIPHTILPTPQAIQFYNKTTGSKAGIFHLAGD